MEYSHISFSLSLSLSLKILWVYVVKSNIGIFTYLILSLSLLKIFQQVLTSSVLGQVQFHSPNMDMPVLVLGILNSWKPKCCFNISIFDDLCCKYGILTLLKGPLLHFKEKKEIRTTKGGTSKPNEVCLKNSNGYVMYYLLNLSIWRIDILHQHLLVIKERTHFLNFNTRILLSWIVMFVLLTCLCFVIAV